MGSHTHLSRLAGRSPGRGRQQGRVRAAAAAGGRALGATLLHLWHRNVEYGATNGMDGRIALSACAASDCVC